MDFFIFPYPAPEGRTDTLKMSYIPQLLEEYIQYKYIYIYSTDTYSLTQRPEGRTDTLQLSYIPQLLAEYIQYKYIYLVYTYSWFCPLIKSLNTEDCEFRKFF